MKLGFAAWASKLDRLPRRDRYALFACAIALLAGIEFAFVLPQIEQRRALEDAGTAQRTSQDDTARAQAEQFAQRLQAVTARELQLNKDLAEIGLSGSRSEPLSALLARLLSGQGAALHSVRVLPVQELSVAAANENGAPGAPNSSAAPVSPAQAASAADAGATALYQHRVELTLGGSMLALSGALAMLETNLKPLRIERLRVGTREGDGAVEATLILTTIGTERTWLAL